MPKAKPTQVIVHRVELQEKERELLEAYVGGSVVKDVGQGLALPVLVGGGVYIGYKAMKSAYQWGNDIIDDIKATNIGKYAQSVPASGGQTLPPPLRGFYHITTWLFG